MSEKNMWKWMRKKGVRGIRLEKCCTKGVPDCLIFNGSSTVMTELKDWQGPKIHKLSVEQMNVLASGGGKVLITIPDNLFAVCDPEEPLTNGDVDWVVENGILIGRDEFNMELLWTALMR